MCKIADQAKLDECVRDAFESLLTRPNENKNGIQVPQFDPLILPMTKFDFSNLNIATLAGGGFEIRNLHIYGFRNSKVMRVRTNLTENSMKILSKIAVPRLFLTGYHGQDLSNPNSKPAGQFNLTLTNVIVKAFFKGQVVLNPEQRVVMKINESLMKVESENLKVSISNIFPDPNLSKFIIH